MAILVLFIAVVFLWGICVRSVRGFDTHGGWWVLSGFLAFACLANGARWSLVPWMMFLLLAINANQQHDRSLLGRLNSWLQAQPGIGALAPANNFLLRRCHCAGNPPAPQQQPAPAPQQQQPAQTRERVAQAAYDAAIAAGRTEAYALQRHQQVWDAWTPPAALRGPWHCHPVVPLLRIPILWRGIEYSDDGRIRVTSPFRNDPTYLPGIKEISFSGWFQEVILGVGYIDVFYSPWMEGKERPLSRRIYIPGWFIREHRDHMERRGYHIG